MRPLRDFLSRTGRRGRTTAWLLAGVLALGACSDLKLPGAAPPRQQEAPEAAASPPERTAPVAETPASSAEARVPETPAERRVPGLISVGLLLPLSGEFAPLGRDLLDAAQMAAFDIAGETFELRIYDTAGLPGVARQVAERARDDGVQLMLGPVLSPSVGAVREIAGAAGLPVVAFTNDRANAGGGVYAIGFSPEDQIARVVAFARRRGMTRVAVLAPDDAYGSRMAAALRDAAADTGAEVTDVAFYSGDTEAVTARIKRLADYEARRQALLSQRRQLQERSDGISRRALARLEGRETLGDVAFEALLLPVGGAEILRLAPLLAFYDIDPGRTKLLGTWLWDDPGLRTEPALAGAWFAAPPPSARRRFVERFEALYDRRPDRRATLGYDATALAVVLAQRAQRTGEAPAETAASTRPSAPTDPYTTAALTSPNGFAGMDGIFRLLPSGVTERGLAVLEIRRDGARVLDPAPTTFAAPTTN